MSMSEKDTKIANRGVIDKVMEANNNGTEAEKESDSNFFVAAQNGDVDTLEWMLDDPVRRRDINFEKRPGGTALLVAAGEGHVRCVELLLDRHADINQRRSFDHLTPILLATMNLKVDVVRLLLSRGADSTVPTIPYKNGPSYSCLHCVTEYIRKKGRHTEHRKPVQALEVLLRRPPSARAFAEQHGYSQRCLQAAIDFYAFRHEGDRNEMFDIWLYGLRHRKGVRRVYHYLREKTMQRNNFRKWRHNWLRSDDTVRAILDLANT